MSLFNELKRRNVIKVAIAYVVVAWLVMQFSDVILNNIEAPGWVFRVIMLILGIGFALSLFFAWAFEMTTEGIKREADVDRSQSITGNTGRKLDRIIIGFLVLALVYFVYERQTIAPPPAIPVTTETVAEGLIPDTPAEPSIAVLPFVNMSSDAEQEFFSDGISEELLNLLVRVKGLKVASRTSSFSYKGTSLNLAEIASELQVDHVLEGSVRKVENRVRITAQLIDAATDRHLWSDTYDRELVDIFAIQDEIANAIVDALRSELGVLADAPAISVRIDTENLNAYQLFLEGRALFIGRSEIGRSIELLETAVGMDSGFARAWEQLGASLAISEGWGVPIENYQTKAMAAAERALELDSSLSMAWSVLAEMTIINDQDYIKSMPLFDKAIENDPLNATAWFWRGLKYVSLGYLEKAKSDIKQCIELDPSYTNCLRHLGRVYMSQGDAEKALEYYLASQERGLMGVDFWAVYPLMASGNRIATVLVLRVQSRDDPDYPIWEFLAALDHPDGNHSVGIEKFERWALKQTRLSSFYDVEWITLGAYDRVTGIHNSTRHWLDAFSDFRASPYFKPFVEGMGYLPYWREHGFPPMCRPRSEEDFECD